MEISTGGYIKYQSERRAVKRQEGVEKLLDGSAYTEILKTLNEVEEYALSGKVKMGNEDSGGKSVKDDEDPKKESFGDVLKRQVQLLRQELFNEVEDSEEGKTFEEFEKESFVRVKEFLKKRFHLLVQQAKLEDMVTNLIKQVHVKDELRENPVIWKNITTLENRIADIDSLVEQEAQTSPEAFVINGLLKLRRGKDTFKKFGVVDTPEVKKIYDNIRKDARKKLEGRNGVIVLQGPTGTGKTVFARRLAQEFSANGEYEFISAHSKMEPDDLISRLGIVAEAIDPKEVPAQIEEALRSYKKNNPEVSEEEISKNVRPLIQKVIERQAGQKVMSTEKILEAVGRAAKNGTKVIIDEFNYLSSETIGALNDFMAKGNAIDGFGIIMTGNIGEEYLKRGDLDPAFINVF
ncbi:MAG TPA: AAA domain-containing protein [Candidatus Moranbacteria bacterium]|nr:AAA domain-containing protein [Candidatus Moranbacteria bacterium]